MKRAPSTSPGRRCLPVLDKELAKAISRRRAWTAASAWVVLLPIGWCALSLVCWTTAACWVSILVAGCSAPQLALTCLALIAGGLLFFASLLPATFALFRRSRLAFQCKAQQLTIRINEMEQESAARQAEREALAEAKDISHSVHLAPPAASPARL